MRTVLLPLSLAAALTWAAVLFGETAPAAPLRPGDRIGHLETIKGQVLEDVVVRSVNARSLVVTHKGGVASLALKDLSPEWQARAGYDPAAAGQAEASLEQAQAAARERQAREHSRTEVVKQRQELARYERIIQSFGSEPELRQEVDMRPFFYQLELGVKSQGRRPSCSVYAIVGAIEFLNAQQTGKAEKFSEEYLCWATMRTVRRKPVEAAEGGQEVEDVRKVDAGFALEEVVQALRGYGLPLLSVMPNMPGRKMTEIPDPSPAVVNDARTRKRVAVGVVPGRDARTVMANLVHVLNEGVPVPIGLRWPGFRSIYRSGYLSDQHPVAGYAHAVTLVGYKCPTGKLEDIVFIFRNSYGTDWGAGGYGQATYHYLERNLLSAVLLEVQTGEQPGNH
jgi:hypothetical protein